MIATALDAYAKGSKRIWSIDRSQTVGASEVGMCARRIAYSKTQGETVPVRRDDDYEESWGATSRGSVYEDHFFVPALQQRFGEDLLFAGPEQRTFVSDFLSATPDGLIVNLHHDALAHLDIPDLGSDCVLLDCKTIDPRTNLTGAKPEHVFQVTVGMGIVRETTNYSPNFAILSYTNASFWDQVTEFVVAFDADVYAIAKDRARQIMSAAHGAQLKPEGIIAGGRECDFCPFTNQCGVARASRVPAHKHTVDRLTVEEITELSRLAKAKEQQAKDLKTASDGIKQQIRDVLEKAGTRSIEGVVSWSAVKGRTTWDDEGIRQAAGKAGVDLDPFRKVGDPSDRLLISLGRNDHVPR